MSAKARSGDYRPGVFWCSSSFSFEYCFVNVALQGSKALDRLVRLEQTGGGNQLQMLSYCIRSCLSDTTGSYAGTLSSTPDTAVANAGHTRYLHPSTQVPPSSTGATSDSWSIGCIHTCMSEASCCCLMPKTWELSGAHGPKGARPGASCT